jgi:hypothetical protein
LGWNWRSSSPWRALQAVNDQANNISSSATATTTAAMKISV